MLNAMAKGTGMIGAAEELLWPAERVSSEVAILYPRSSFFWDQSDVELPHAIMGCTNVNMQVAPDYLREVYAIYQTLATQLNIPVDFLDEDEVLIPASLAKLKVIYVTEPDLPLAVGAALVAWTKAGGTLVTMPGTGAFDQYNAPAPAFQSTLGFTEEPKERDCCSRSVSGAANGTGTTKGTLTAALTDKSPGSDKASCSTFQTWGMTTKANEFKGDVVATFADKSPAITINEVGAGKSAHFYWFAGSSNVFGAECTSRTHGWCSKYPANVSGTPFQASMAASQQTIKALLWNITTGLGGAKLPVTTSSPDVEAPLLAGPTGSVVTLLNWRFNTTYPFYANATSVPALTVNVSLGFTPTKVESVEHGPLTAQPIAGETGVVTVTVPLESADLLLFHK